MTEITLYNTHTRRKEPLVPLDPGNVRMYVCGPTVYDRAHIGNARAVVVFDTLFRLLRHTYGPEHVTYVRNITDVDDKINARAAATKLPGETELAAIRRITDETIGWYHADMDALGALRPTLEPRATEFIAPMVAMIELLIAKGHAYAAEGHVLFSVSSDPDYGKLARRSLEDMRAGARVEVAPYKRDPMDFVLWKPSDATTPGWPSPWGHGRPGWHIECSAMAYELLGQSFDIHGGGIDLAFPHHENELAQSRCAHPEGDFAHIWMHNGMLNVEGDKMSKSLGNFFTVRELLDKGIPGEVIRFVLLSTHYTQPMDWTQKRVDEAVSVLRKWAELASPAADTQVDPEVLDSLGEDLNTWEAIDRLHELHAIGDAKALSASAQLLGLDLGSIAISDWARPFSYTTPEGSILIEGQDYAPTVGVVGWGPMPDEERDFALDVARAWLKLRRDKEWGKADELRSRAAENGLELRATRSANGVNGASVSLNSRIDVQQLGSLLHVA